MKRLIILAVLAVGTGACGGDQASPTDADDATATAEATQEATATAEPTEEAAASPTTGDGTALADLIPAELNGQPGTPIPGMDQLMAGMLQQQGITAENIEFEFVTYGEDENGVVLTAFRIPGMTELAMEQLARSLSGVESQPGAEAESVTIGGKSVLRMTSTAQGQEGVVYMYFADDAAFTVVSQDASSAEALLAELP